MTKIRAELEIRAGKYQKGLGTDPGKRSRGKDREIQEQRDLKARQSAELAEIVAGAGKEYPHWQKEYDKQTEQKSYVQFRG